VIYFCIPVHNEEKTAGVVLWKIRQVMAEFPRDYQILLADDASDDGTMQVVDPYRRVLPLILMRFHRRRGYAASLEMLLREAARRSRYPRRDIVIVMQADFSEDADHVPAMLRRMESGADLVVGGPVASAVRPGFVERTAARLAHRLLARRAWPEGAADPLNGFAAYRLSCVRRAFEENGEGRLLRWEGGAANAALLAAAAPHARRIDAVELMHHPERRQRPRRHRPIAALLEVRRFLRNRPDPHLEPPAALAPDEVHGDLSALRQPHEPSSEEARSEPRRRDARRPRRDARERGEREQEGEGARKERKPRSPRREAGAGRKPGGRSEAPEKAGTETARAGAEPGRRPRGPRGTRGGQRSARKPRRPAGEAGGRPADATPPDMTGELTGSPSAPSAREGANGEASERKRRRRGRRGRGGRRPGGSQDPGGPPGENAEPRNEETGRGPEGTDGA
jgi:hypothetical protein